MMRGCWRRVKYRTVADSIQLHTDNDIVDGGKDDAAELMQSIQWNFYRVLDCIEDLKTRGECLTYHNDACICLHASE
jgi:hypothetical protein